jgi:hypothetical protein
MLTGIVWRWRERETSENRDFVGGRIHVQNQKVEKRLPLGCRKACEINGRELLWLELAPQRN